MTMIAVGATVAGTAVSAAGTISSGNAAKKSADYEAAQMRDRANTEMALGQQEGQQYERKRDLALSTLTNRSAGFMGPTTDALAEDISKWGTLQARTAQFGGEERSRAFNASAEGREYEGEMAKLGSRYKAAATILGGVSGIADKFAPRGPSRGNYYFG
jgi:hypothetical protein